MFSWDLTWALAIQLHHQDHSGTVEKLSRENKGEILTRDLFTQKYLFTFFKKFVSVQLRGCVIYFWLNEETLIRFCFHLQYS